MEGGKGFDPYEVIGIIAPGTILALVIAFELPLFRSLLGGEGLSVGDLGLFILIAFVFGHLVQAFGNLIEPVVWPRAGLPTNRVRFSNQTLLSPAQRTALQSRICDMEGGEIELHTINRTHWRACTTRAYGRLRAAGRTTRVDIFNRIYGLSRGVAASLILTLLWCVYAHSDQRALLAALAVMILAAIWRMRRAGIHYARALLLEFIDLDVGPAPAT